jgi:predicted PurR-regulated permease PerM
MNAPHRIRASAEERPFKHVSTNATIAVIAATVLLLYLVREMLLPFVIAGILAYVLTPLVDTLARRLRSPRRLVAFAVGLILLAVVAAVAWLGEPLVVHELGRGARDVADMRGFVHHWIGGNSVTLLGKQWTDIQIANDISSAGERLFTQVGGIAGVLLWGFAGFFGVLLCCALLFYFLIGAHAIARGLLWLIPPLDRPLVQHIWRELDPVLRRYFIGLGVIVVYAALAAFLGLGIILRTPHAPVLALITGFLELIPIAGPVASAVLAGILTIHSATGPGAILGYVAYAIALRLSIDQLIGPIVLGHAARVQPSLVIFCFLAGAVLFGAPGVVLAVPVALMIKVSAFVLYGERRA